MESLFILLIILFSAIAIYRIVFLAISTGGSNNSFYAYEAPQINPTTGCFMFNSCVDTVGKAYGQF